MRPALASVLTAALLLLAGCASNRVPFVPEGAGPRPTPAQARWTLRKFNGGDFIGQGKFGKLWWATGLSIDGGDLVVARADGKPPVRLPLRDLVVETIPGGDIHERLWVNDYVFMNVGQRGPSDYYAELGSALLALKDEALRAPAPASGQEKLPGR